MIDDQTLQALEAGYATPQHMTRQATKPKGNMFTNLLPAIGGGLGAVAGIPLDIFGGAGSIAGAAGGSALGEALKEKLLHENLSAKQVGIQGLEGGALSAFQPIKIAKGASGAAKGFVNGGADAVTQASGQAGGSTGNVVKNLITQGQQAQGRVAGISAGTKIAGKELTPQDTVTMLNTLRNEGINTGNANNTLRDVQDKLTQYGKQISDHFTGNNQPLTPADTKTLAANFLQSINTTDPGVMKQAQIVANDLEKNVKDTKGLWQFRVGLDSRIPDAKMAAGDNVLTNKLAAVKGMRQFIAGQLGDIPGASSYHALSDVKPFVSAEAKRLNNPGGGLIGRFAASGPVQKTESNFGKATEAIGNKMAGNTPTTLEDALSQASLPPESMASQARAALKGSATLPLRAAAAPAAYPGKSAVQVGKQVIGRGVGNALTATQGGDQSGQGGDLASALMGAGGDQSSQDQTASASPYSQEDLMADLQRDPKNAAKYIDYYDSLDKIFNQSSGTAIKPTGQQYGLATGGYNSLQQLAGIMQQDPNVVARNQTPGQGLPLVGSLVTHAAGAGDYHALADNVLQSLIHLQTGATATPEEVKAARGQLPQPGDTAEQRQRKIDNLTSMFAPYINGGQTGQASASPTDLASALLSAGYGQ
jgi:hypothetical protein